MIADDRDWFQVGLDEVRENPHVIPKHPDHEWFASPNPGECLEDRFKKYFAGHNVGNKERNLPERCYQNISAWGLKPYRAKQPEAASV